MFLIQISTSLKESQTVDEGVHLAAGYSYLLKNDFRMNQEHPPFIKELAALPLLIISQKLDSPFTKANWDGYNEWLFAKDLIYDNTVPADTILLLGRLPMMLLSLVLAFFIFKWSKELFGVIPGLFALALYCFSPDFIAHGRYVTTDVGLTLFFFITIYYFYKYLKSGKNGYLFFTALFLGLALASKFSSVILILILPVLFFLYFLKPRNSITPGQIIKKFFSNFVFIFIISFLVILTTYRFEFKTAYSDPNVRNLYEYQEELIRKNQTELSPIANKIVPLTDLRKPSGQIIKYLAEKVPIPAYSYLAGLVKLFGHNFYGHMSYLMGQYSNFGWWYYFPLAFFFKEPLGFLALLAILFGYLLAKLTAIVKNNRRSCKNVFNQIPFSTLALMVPPLIYFVWSLTSHLNLGIRHIFIIFPFLFVGAGSLLNIKFKNRGNKIFYWLAALLLFYYCLSSIFIYPHYLAYFNELAGGPGNAPKYLVDSNIDWGQDLKKLKEYMEENDINHVCLSYFGQAKLEYYGIDYWYLPDTANFHGTENLNCVVAISITSLYSQQKEYDWLLSYTPTEKIGYSIYVYDFRLTN
jgi:hypothetical protein